MNGIRLSRDFAVQTVEAGKCGEPRRGNMLMRLWPGSTGGPLRVEMCSVVRDYLERVEEMRPMCSDSPPAQTHPPGRGGHGVWKSAGENLPAVL